MDLLTYLLHLCVFFSIYIISVLICHGFSCNDVEYNSSPWAVMLSWNLGNCPEEMSGRNYLRRKWRLGGGVVRVGLSGGGSFTRKCLGVLSMGILYVGAYPHA